MANTGDAGQHHAAVADVGSLEASKGNMVPVATVFLSASGSATPSMALCPNLPGLLASLRSKV